jgi:YegS/Rv2252/BmrU family lipid kinase
MTARRDAIAILNPETGRRPADDLEALLRRILEQRYNLDIQRSTYPGEARCLAERAAAQADLVIAVGGDGTVREVVAGMRDTPASLGIIPNGSANVVARGLGIPIDPAGAARALVGPTASQSLDIVVSDDDCFVHMAGAGFDGLMMRDTSPSLKRAVGWLAYFPPALSHLDDQIYHYRITVDHTAVTADARMVLLANGSFVLHPRFPIGREIRADDGLLDVCIFTPPDIASTASVAGLFALGLVDRSPHFQQLTGKTVRIESDPPAPVEFDGDFVGTTPIAVRIQPAAVEVCLPAPLAK